MCLQAVLPFGERAVSPLQAFEEVERVYAVSLKGYLATPAARPQMETHATSRTLLSSCAWLYRRVFERRFHLI